MSGIHSYSNAARGMKRKQGAEESSRVSNIGKSNHGNQHQLDVTGTDGSQAFYQPPTIKSASRHGQSLDEDSANEGDNIVENKT